MTSRDLQETGLTKISGALGEAAYYTLLVANITSTQTFHILLQSDLLDR